MGYWTAALPGAWHYSIYVATLGESLAGQMGSAAFMAFLMSLCDKRFSASHYAFLSMLFGLSGRLCGYLGGWLAALLRLRHLFLSQLPGGLAGLRPAPLGAAHGEKYRSKGSGEQ